MPGDEDYIAVDRLITPLVLNYCQCMLELEEYYEVLEHTSDLIHKHKGNTHTHAGTNTNKQSCNPGFCIQK